MKENSSRAPVVKQFSTEIQVDESETSITLFVVEFANAIQIAVYEKMPSLGSMSFGYIDGEVTQNLEIFSGNHNQFSNALALIVAKKTGKLVYASVNLTRESIVDLTMVKDLLDKYLQTLIE